MTNHLVYLAAPYSGTPEQVGDRMHQLCVVDAVLMGNGIFTVSPLMKHFILGHGDLPGDWNYWKTYSEVLLQTCSQMIVLAMDGWETSTGVQAEIELCKKYNVPYVIVNSSECNETINVEALKKALYPSG